MTVATAIDDHSASVVDERPRDAVPSYRAFLRSMRPLRVIADKSLRGPFTQQQFLATATTIQRQAAESSRIEDKTVALWRMEKLCYYYCRNGQNSLANLAIPTELQPIAHVGLGIAAIENAEFVAESLTDFIDRHTHPNYRLFPYESVGFIRAVAVSKWFKVVFRVVTKAKLPSCTLPQWNEFIGHFSNDVQRLVSHGYGRALYFQKLGIRRAINAAVRLDALDTSAVVQGIAFAYAMLNHIDLSGVLESGSDLTDPNIAEPFRKGLIHAFVFWEWTFPGFLDLVRPPSRRARELAAHAREVVAESHRPGRFVAFGVA